MHGDYIWGSKKVYDLVQGFHIEDLGDGVLRAIESGQPTYYEQKQAAYDRGVPEMALDAIQLDVAIERMTDMPARAALHLRIAGFDPQDIGAVIRDRRRRTGAQLIESGVKAILRHEKRRAAR